MFVALILFLGNPLTYEVAPRDLSVTIIEHGALESQSNVPVYCEVEDVRNDSVVGTPILWIIQNGSSVSEGDLICEIDSTGIRFELDNQILKTEEAKSAFAQAEADVENRLVENDTNKEQAELNIKIARLELEMFTDPKMGSHRLEIEDMQRKIDEATNDIFASSMSLDLKLEEKRGIDSLFKLGYAGKSEMDRTALEYLREEGEYASKLNGLQTLLATKENLETYEKQMRTMRLEGALNTQLQNLSQVIANNESRLTQMRGTLSSRREQLNKEEERLKRYQMQLTKCMIYAPQDGMVVHSLAEGTPIRPRQHIMSIPNLKRMQANVKIHESDLGQVKPGLTALIDVLGETYAGTVASVAVLPEDSEVKSYETIITIDEDVQINPGMTAVCEINVEHYSNVIAVPIQAIVRRGGKNFVRVDTLREVKLGAYNDRFVIVEHGLKAGDLVVLNPGR